MTLAALKGECAGDFFLDMPGRQFGDRTECGRRSTPSDLNWLHQPPARHVRASSVTLKVTVAFDLANISVVVACTRGAGEGDEIDRRLNLMTNRWK